MLKQTSPKWRKPTTSSPSSSSKAYTTPVQKRSRKRPKRSTPRTKNNSAFLKSKDVDTCCNKKKTLENKVWMLEEEKNLKDENSEHADGHESKSEDRNKTK